MLGALGFFLFEETFNTLLYAPERPLPVLEGTDALEPGPVLSFSERQDTPSLYGDPQHSAPEFGDDLRVLRKNAELLRDRPLVSLTLECDADVPIARVLPYLKTAASLGIEHLYQVVRPPTPSWPYTDKYARSAVRIELKPSLDHLLALARTVRPQAGLTCSTLARDAAQARRAGMQVFLALDD